MIKVENIVTPSNEQWERVIMGCRNPKNSWKLSDSDLSGKEVNLGEKDLKLMKILDKASKDHRKYMRMIPVYMDIVAPFYWWKEADTYKVGVTCNSCSTMHKLTAKEFSLNDFSCEKLDSRSMKNLCDTINLLNELRKEYLETNDNDIWYNMIQLLPSSSNQKRTLMLDYEVLANMYHSRKNHKLDEWREFCKIIKEELPYSFLITNEFSLED